MRTEHSSSLSFTHTTIFALEVFVKFEVENNLPHLSPSDSSLVFAQEKEQFQGYVAQPPNKN